MNKSATTGNQLLLKAVNLVKNYKIGEREIRVLKGIEMSLKKGEFVAIVGPSGAGKSTLLHILGTLERPSSGELWINDLEAGKLDESHQAELRRKNIGFVFQFHHLLPAFTALENVLMPMLIMGKERKKAETSAQELLESMGLSERLNNKPAELSGGEQQRVAVARALINKPNLILADEPSGNLDRVTGRVLEDDLVRFARERGAAVLVVTHNENWASRADRVLTLIDGIFVRE